MLFHRIFRIVIWTVTVFFMVGLQRSGPGLFAQQEKTEAYFYSKERQIPLIVDLNRLGIVARDSVSKDRIVRFIARYKRLWCMNPLRC